MRVTESESVPAERPQKPRRKISKAESRRREKQRESAKKPALPAELIEANLEHCAKAGLAAHELPRRKHEREHVHGARALPPFVRLLGKREVTTIAGVSFPTIWSWMRAGKFPRSRIVGGKSMWLSTEIDSWVAELPVRPLKGDARDEVA
jgi:prophage regulatory protein